MTTTELVDDRMRASVANRLHQSITKALKFGAMLEQFPTMLKDLIEQEYWKFRECREFGRPFVSVVEYLEHHEPDGCQVSRDKVEALIRHDPEVLTLWRKAAVGKRGGDRGNQYTGGKVGISNFGEPKNSRSYQLARLSEQAPALHAAVCAGELSANAAAIKAGIRKPPKPTLAKIKSHIAQLSDSERRELVAWLMAQEAA